MLSEDAEGAPARHGDMIDATTDWIFISQLITLFVTKLKEHLLVGMLLLVYRWSEIILFPLLKDQASGMSHVTP